MSLKDMEAKIVAAREERLASEAEAIQPGHVIKKADVDLTDGVKADEGKVRMDLIPPEALFALASVLTVGAIKYTDRNWEKGMQWGRVFAAMMRHMWCWWGGKGPTNKSFLFGDLDDETNYSHLWHALCCLVFLLTYEARGVGTDDRFKDPNPGEEMADKVAPLPSIHHTPYTPGTRQAKMQLPEGWPPKVEVSRPIEDHE